MARPGWSPDTVDPDRPSVARMYDYSLGGSHSVEADRAPAGVAGLRDFARPVAVMMVELLRFIPDTGDPAPIAAAYRDALAPGSHMVPSHATLDGDTELMRDHEQIHRRSATPIHGRTRTQVNALFDGFELGRPEVVYLPLWRPEPDGAPTADPERYAGYAAVGRLP
ncbi:MAG TPA: SAM-dependent methyltransferase [Actinocrinis sp.]|nr:SAM-dependent methyltransferase [Actinocrinis sp.]